MKLLFYISLVFFFGILDNVSAQDLSQIGKGKNPFKVSGGISANQIFYTVDDIDSRRPPYNYFLSGNLSFSLYGWSVPLSFTFSNQQAAFRQPFNQYGVQPTYKWIKVYLGYNSMTFSPYTLNGHIFLGTGVELTPPKSIFRFSAMYGRLNKAVNEDTLSSDAVPSYLRMGYGIKTGVAKRSDYLYFILFKAQDVVNSLEYVPLNNDVLPAENLVLGIQLNKKLAQRVNFSLEYARSAYSRDVRAEESDRSGVSVMGMFSGIYKNRISSSYNGAFKTGLTYTGKTFTLGMGFERIDPLYSTMGAYYFNNDLQNLTANASKRLFKGKMNIAGSIGSQKNNLNNQKMSEMSRLIWSFNLNITPNSRLNISSCYSNFQSFTRIRSAFENINQLTPYNSLDTLNYVQVTNSANLGVNYLISRPDNKNCKQNVSTNISYQLATNSYATSNVKAGTAFVNGNFSYSVNFVPRSFSISIIFNANRSELSNQSTLTLGPTLSFTKGLYKNRLKLTLANSWNKSFVGTKSGNRIINSRLSASYQCKKHHSFNLSIVVLNRNQYLTQPSFTEFTGTVGYNYSF